MRPLSSLMNAITHCADFMELSIKVTKSYPVELHYIKALLVEQQYRQCITACREVSKLYDKQLIKQPLQHTFVQFYLALAHDELARTMHNFSQAKIPAFNQAQQFYREALAALPKPEECIESVAEPPKVEGTRRDSCHVLESLSRHTSLASFGSARLFKSMVDTRSPPTSPPTHIRKNSLPMRSPPISSPGTTASDLDDLESHESFNEIMTPNRLPKLERDYSSISLLQPPRHSHGLMPPIRLGSPAKPYHLPPGLRQNRRSILPRLNTGPSDSSPVRKQLRSPSEQTSPIESPVSPLGWEGDSITSDASTISPISPETPDAAMGFDENHVVEGHQESVALLNEHLQGMRSQLESLIELLQKAKQQTIDVQAERLVPRSAPHKEGKLSALIDAAGTKNKQLPQLRSYWSLTAEDSKLLERQRRVEAGRNRDWMRPRFDPEKYQGLAEAALAEL